MSFAGAQGRCIICHFVIVIKLPLTYFYKILLKFFLISINPDPLGSKNITIHYPGAIYGTFIINQFTWSLFWQFWYLIVHWFKFKKLAILLPGAFFSTFWKIWKKNFLQKIILYIKKVKVKFSQNFWLMISSLKK